MKTEILILNVLDNHDPELVRAVPMRNAVEIEGGKDVSLSDLNAKLRRMEVAGEVILVNNEDTGAKWGITDKGKARLAKALD